MARTARKSNGWALSAASAALIASAAALAQNASVDAEVSGSATLARPAVIEPEVQSPRHSAVSSSDCGSGLVQFLKELTSPPNPFGAACDLRDDW